MRPERHQTRPTRPRGAAAVGGVALLLGLPLVASACTQSPAAPPELAEVQSPEPLTVGVIDDGDGKSAVVVEDGQPDDVVGDPQTLSSTLTVGDGSCYYLAREGGPPSTLLVFPSGTTLEAGDVPSVVVDGEAFPDGTLVEVTGGDVQLSPENLDRASPCTGTAGSFLVTAAQTVQGSEPDESPSS